MVVASLQEWKLDHSIDPSAIGILAGPLRTIVDALRQLETIDWFRFVSCAASTELGERETSGCQTFEDSDLQ